MACCTAHRTNTVLVASTIFIASSCVVDHLPVLSVGAYLTLAVWLSLQDLLRSDLLDCVEAALKGEERYAWQPTQEVMLTHMLP